MAASLDPYTMEMPSSGVNVLLGRINLIARGQGRCFSVGRFRIAVFHQRDGSFFALENASRIRAAR
ncbi:MAG: hypothetical protein JO166_11480 [Deltaproteobacteria bacterium]|nr:hypothetical protein [Deltaproteobacteria bacterium]